MNPLSFSVADERINLFVGRETQCEWVQHWLSHPHPPTRVVGITGMAGVGKSSLLVRLLQIAQAEGAHTAWVDGRTCYRTPRGFLDSLPPSFAQWQATDDGPPPMVVAIDNYDDLQVLESWLREVFLQDMPDEGLLLLVASRGYLMSQWELDPGWRSRTVHWPLDAFTPDEVEDFLMRREWPLEEVITARRLAKGHPLSLAVLAEARRKSSRASSPDEWSGLIRDTLSAELLREITDPALQPLVDVLTLMAEANLDILQRVLQKNVSIRQYHALRELSFVKRTGRGVGLHDVASMHLFDDFREREPQAFEHLRQQAVNVLLNEWDAVPPAQHGALAQQLLWLCRDIFQDISQFADMSYAASELYVTGYDPKDHATAHRLIASWGRQSLPLPVESSLSLFDRIVAESPESIRVTRNCHGEAMALTCSLMLHEATIALLEEYHPTAVASLLAGPFNIARCAVEDANASFNILIGIDREQSCYSQDQLMGVVVRDQFSFQAGALGLVSLTIPEIKSFLAAIGYRAYPFPVSGDPHLEEELFVLDLRRHHFGDWIRYILSRRHPDSLRTPVTAQDVRYFLTHWGETAVLKESRLALIKGTHRDVKQFIEQLLHEPPHPPMTVRDLDVLRATFFDTRQPAWRVAQRLHVSRATLYRYQDQALAHLAEVLS